MKGETVRDVLRSDRSGRVGRHRRRCWYLGQKPAIGPPELELAVGQSLDLVALLVHSTMMPAAEQDEIG
jgi:hypothetical protein